ncbi:hypothetical protein BDN70DRAFT_591981 [Pholiota conissans]|uniref:Uncharacterized protein n=1 Tax=Pholiota conissans TaxID=109636 RepID=A0A9P5ZE98_9AGAR|nr:hypothetical protein BDN70DRAFT_591981 [Pholiota conissans]
MLFYWWVMMMGGGAVITLWTGFACGECGWMFSIFAFVVAPIHPSIRSSTRINGFVHHHHYHHSHHSKHPPTLFFPIIHQPFYDQLRHDFFFVLFIRMVFLYPYPPRLRHSAPPLSVAPLLRLRLRRLKTLKKTRKQYPKNKQTYIQTKIRIRRGQ